MRRGVPALWRATLRRTVPRSVNLAALLRRLSRIWRILVRSAWMKPIEVGQWTVDLVAVAGEHRADGAEHGLDHVGDVEGLEVDVHAAGLDLGEVEDVGDEAEQVLAGELDLAQLVGGALEAALVGLLEQHLGVADDGVERGAQLVAHVGEEAALGERGLLGDLLGLAQAAFGVLELGDVGGDADRADRLPCSSRRGERVSRTGTGWPSRADRLRSIGSCCGRWSPGCEP
jgi:hypothetical protein